jgi:hypothetical protein
MTSSQASKDLSICHRFQSSDSRRFVLSCDSWVVGTATRSSTRRYNITENIKNCGWEVRCLFLALGIPVVLIGGRFTAPVIGIPLLLLA